MARNLKKDYIAKLIKMETKNGYKFDLANYVANPHLSYEYPTFYKVIDSDDEKETIRRVYYMKYYGGTGEYREEIYKRRHDGGEWYTAMDVKEKTLEESSRFNIKKLISFC